MNNAPERKEIIETPVAGEVESGKAGESTKSSVKDAQRLLNDTVSQMGREELMTWKNDGHSKNPDIDPGRDAGIARLQKGIREGILNTEQVTARIDYVLEWSYGLF